jgi:hypothetical protein
LPGSSGAGKLNCVAETVAIGVVGQVVESAAKTSNFAAPLAFHFRVVFVDTPVCPGTGETGVGADVGHCANDPAACSVSASSASAREAFTAKVILSPEQR